MASRLSTTARSLQELTAVTSWEGTDGMAAYNDFSASTSSSTVPVGMLSLTLLQEVGYW